MSDKIKHQPTPQEITGDTIELLREIKKLMELRGENSFKIRAFDKAAQSLIGRDDLLERAKAGTLTELEGIGKGISEVMTEFLLQGRSTARDELAQSLPAGLLELTEIPGLGPKKAIVLIEELGIHSVGELEYACKENRLLKLKGFGAKIQQKLLDGISFRKSNLGHARLVDVIPFAQEFLSFLRAQLVDIQICETGDLRRQTETMDRLDFLVELKAEKDVQKRAESALSLFQKDHPGNLRIVLHFSETAEWGYQLAKTTGSSLHWDALKVTGGDSVISGALVTENEFYLKMGLPWISPEMRETGEELELAKQGQLEDVLPWDGIRGVFHNHTTRSDGVATLEQMVSEAERLGYEYIGVSDHSQSAFYAQGLKEATLLEQEKEVRLVQKRHPKVRLFWGIESDILADGSLDYDSKVLKRFDFVIASVHSRFNMDRSQMTERILTAIRNPCTRFLGHPTGRLLLGRKAYEVDMEALIEEAAQCNVAIELNSNPARLDLDWRWGSAMRKSKTLTSINPDAHDLDGLQDVRYGIAMARKALIPTRQVINSRNTIEVDQWLQRK